MKLLSICLVSSEVLELAKLIKEQYTATHADHFNWKRNKNEKRITSTDATKQWTLSIEYNWNKGKYHFFRHLIIINKWKTYREHKRYSKSESECQLELEVVRLNFHFHELRVLFEGLCYGRMGQIFVALKRMSHFCQNNSKHSRKPSIFRHFSVVSLRELSNFKIKPFKPEISRRRLICIWCSSWFLMLCFGLFIAHWRQKLMNCI